MEPQAQIIEMQEQLAKLTNLSPEEEKLLAAQAPRVQELLNQVGDFVNDILNRPG